ncbi:MAG: hypothetical protein A2017_03900 [Lentisphaerae bacterium GWF2_44_16]|nr:MAG: hypothetical protein A2017_03900 [Lentisphaerae bacterium GWF2_44_16]
MELIKLKEDNELSHIALSGRLDVNGVQQIEQSFMAATALRGKPAIVDISEVSFLASLGMRMFLNSAKALKQQKTRIVLLNPQPLVEDSLRSAGLTSVIPIEYDIDTAMGLLKG